MDSMKLLQLTCFLWLHSLRLVSGLCVSDPCIESQWDVPLGQSAAHPRLTQAWQGTTLECIADKQPYSV